MNFYTLAYSNSAKPTSYTLHTADGKEIRLIEDNADVAARYASAPRREFITIPNARSAMMNAYIIRPADFSPSRRYPVIMHQYSGPGSQQVLDSWSIDWMQYAAMKATSSSALTDAAQAVATAYQETVVYKNLGHFETLDQQAAARWIGSQPYVDPARIGICGWSYGGYETLMAVTTGSSPLRGSRCHCPRHRLALL